MKVLVTYDGTPDAKAALAYGIKKARSTEGELITVHVLRSDQFRDVNGEPYCCENNACEAIQRYRSKSTFVNRNGHRVRTTIVFAMIDTCQDILAYAEKFSADLLVAPPAFDQLLEKACCLVDIVSDRRGYFGTYKKPVWKTMTLKEAYPEATDPATRTML